MKVVRLKGGWGNQMFQIHAAYSRNGTFENVYVDTDWYDNGKRRPDVQKYLDIPVVTKSERWITLGWRSLLRNRLRSRKIYQKTISSRAELYDTVNKSTQSNEYLQGYFQEEGWQNVEVFRKFVKEVNGKMFPHKTSPNGRCLIHVRLGDYGNSRNTKVYKKVDLSFYAKAIRETSLTCKNFDITTNGTLSIDFQIMLETLEIEKNICFNVLEASEDISIPLLEKLSNYSYYIIPNSTFSFWLAALSENSVMTILPRTWFKDRPFNPFMLFGGKRFDN